jgi:hypothetical protein
MMAARPSLYIAAQIQNGYVNVLKCLHVVKQEARRRCDINREGFEPWLQRRGAQA